MCSLKNPFDQHMDWTGDTSPNNDGTSRSPISERTEFGTEKARQTPVRSPASCGLMQIRPPRDPGHGFTSPGCQGGLIEKKRTLRQARPLMQALDGSHSGRPGPGHGDRVSASGDNINY